MTLSSREKYLAGIVVAAVFVFLNLLLLSAFGRRLAALREELDQQRMTWSSMQDLLANSGASSARDAALTAKQPQLTNENAAGVELLDTVREIAKAHNLTPENEVVGEVEKNQWYRSVSVTMDTHSTWPDLIAFFYALQKPDQFLVCENTNIQVDPSDQTKMLGHLKIARWYAP